MKTSEKLQYWMKHFYTYSSEEDNKQSKLLDESIELRKIIKEIKVLEGRK